MHAGEGIFVSNRAFLCRTGQFCVEPCILLSNRAFLCRTSVIIMQHVRNLITVEYGWLVINAFYTKNITGFGFYNKKRTTWFCKLIFVTIGSNFILGPYESCRAKLMTNRLPMKCCKHLIAYFRGNYSEIYTNHLKFGHLLGEIYEGPIFKWVALTWLWNRAPETNSPSNGHRVDNFTHW